MILFSVLREIWAWMSSPSHSGYPIRLCFLEVSLSRYAFHGTHYILCECGNTLGRGKKGFSSTTKPGSLACLRMLSLPLKRHGILGRKAKAKRSVIVLPNFEMYTRSCSINMSQKAFELRSRNQYFYKFITGNALWYFMSSWGDI